MPRKANILAVDDKVANLVALEAVLNDSYNIVTATSGAEAIAVLQSRHDIDVILMDIQMPDMDGFEATGKIKEMPHCREIPVIFITAIFKEDPFIRKGYEAGAVDYFSKPFDPEILKLKLGIYASHRLKAELLRQREHQIFETEQLMRAGRKLSSVLENLNVGILIADHEGRICQINHEVSNICKANEPIARDSYGEMIGWWDSKGKLLKDSQGPLGRALEHGETSEPELMNITCLDGTSKTILGSASPLLGLEGQVVGAAVVIQDVTEPKKIEKDLEHRISQLISLGVGFEKSAIAREQ